MNSRLTTGLLGGWLILAGLAFIVGVPALAGLCLAAAGIVMLVAM